MTFCNALETLHLECLKRQHRGIVSLCGNEGWVREQLVEVRSHWDSAALVVSNSTGLSQDSDQLIESKLYRSTLGTQHTLLIWNAFDGIEPDAFSAVSGAIEGGGLLVLLMPETHEALAQSDLSDLSSVDTHERPRFTNYTLQRFLNKLHACNLHINYDQSTGLRFLIDSAKPIKHQAQTSHPQTSQLHLNSEQENCLAEIARVQHGHRHRPLTIKADRGRGKSTVLAFAAAKAVLENIEQHIIVVVNKRDSLDVFQQHFKTLTAADSSAHERLCVWAIDALLDKLPPASCVFVDEAASFPLPQLEKLLIQYPRLVFASTLHGYEGSGRGFGIKFDELLSRHCESWKHCELNTPVRWADQDPLEQLLFDAFLLNAELPELKKQAQKSTHIGWYRGKDLYKDEPLTKQIFALLVLAHYQTRPNDLRLLLDHPAVHIACLQGDDLLGAALCIEEGGDSLIEQPNVTSLDILNGRRRPKGHLVAQSLAVFNQDPIWLTTPSLRVMRIAVHPQARNKGLGSELLSAIRLHSAQLGFSFTSVSFGVSSELVRFWSKNSFSALRLGYKPDASSGTSSLIAIVPNQKSKYGKRLNPALIAAQERFFEHFTVGLSRYFKVLNPTIVEAILETCITKVNQIQQQDTLSAESFVAGTHQVNDAWPMLERLLIAALAQKKLSSMSSKSKQLLIMFVLQAHEAKVCIEQSGLKGKKALQNALRESTREVLSLIQDKTIETK